MFWTAIGITRKSLMDLDCVVIDEVVPQGEVSSSILSTVRGVKLPRMRSDLNPWASCASKTILRLLWAAKALRAWGRGWAGRSNDIVRSSGVLCEGGGGGKGQEQQGGRAAQCIYAFHWFSTPP